MDDKVKVRTRGRVVAELRGPDGVLKQRVVTHNLVTDVGDQYFAEIARSGAPIAMAAADNMKCGDTDTPPQKNGAGSFTPVAEYIANSAHAHDGWVVGGTADSIRAIHTWAAGEATATHRTVSIVDNLVNAGEADATNTISDANYGADVVKLAADTLQVTWTITFLGA